MRGPYLTISSVKVQEGNSGRTSFTAEVMLGYWSTPATVRVFAMPGSAGDSDYEFAPVQLTLSPNVPQTVTGYVVGDVYPEGDELFTLSATGISDSGAIGYGSYGYVSVSGGAVTIMDDDAASGLYTWKGPP